VERATSLPSRTINDDSHSLESGTQRNKFQTPQRRLRSWQIELAESQRPISLICFLNAKQNSYRLQHTQRFPRFRSPGDPSFNVEFTPPCFPPLPALAIELPALPCEAVAASREENSGAASCRTRVTA
jgi:hypothetical protein